MDRLDIVEQVRSIRPALEAQGVGISPSSDRGHEERIGQRAILMSYSTLSPTSPFRFSTWWGSSNGSLRPLDFRQRIHAPKS